ncbi:bone marrow stromal antigen 2 [Callospermophilus lateralis]|uniref:bone marrow stromal antigen 2 n=1 Tax=Callospermophilus lateralis TaxID=76772 RepID=UPI0040542F50
MAPSFCHYSPVPMDEQMKEGGPRRCCLWLLVGFVLAGLIIALSIFTVKYYSEACQNGLQLERQCHNVTQLLKKQLIQAKEESLAAETRADTCDQTVVKLKAQELQLQARVQELERNVTGLNQRLQETLTKLERPRTENTQTTPASSQATIVLQLSKSLLLLSLATRLL